jgi:hypothetical protein
MVAMAVGVAMSFWLLIPARQRSLISTTAHIALQLQVAMVKVATRMVHKVKTSFFPFPRELCCAISMEM